MRMGRSRKKNRSNKMEKIELIEKKKPSCKYPEFGNHEPLDFTGIKDRINILKPDESQDKIETAVKKVAVNVANIPVDKQEPESQATSGKLNFEIPPKEVEEKNQLSTQLGLLKDEYTLGQLLDMNIREIPFLIEKLIPKETIVTIAGQSDTGKSTFYSQLALAIINGDNEFLGLKIHAIHKKVLIISTEDGSVAVSYRIIRQLNDKILDKKVRDNLVVKCDYENLEKRITNILKQMSVDLIVVDAFGDVYDDNINSSNSTRRFLNKYNDIIRKFHCAVLFVHHVSKSNNSTKPEKDKLLGSVGIEGKMRNVIMLSVNSDQYHLKVVKGNYVSRAEKAKPIFLCFDEKTLTFSVTDEPVKSIEADENSLAGMTGSRSKGKPGRKRDMNLYNQVIKLHKEGIRQIKIAEKLGMNKSTVCRWIKDFREKGNDDSSPPVDEAA